MSIHVKQEIESYVRHGFSIIPVAFKGKKPLVKWQEFQHSKPTASDIAEWFPTDPTMDLNIGIVTGAVSGIVVLDVDGEDGERSLVSLGTLPKTATVRTGKGKHLYFRHPGVRIGNFVRKLPGLDLRADGGFVVGPPSVHENGHPYVWEHHPDDAGIADLPPTIRDLIEGPQFRDRQPRVEEAQRNESQANGAIAPSVRATIHRLFGELAMAREGERNDTLNRVAFQLGQHCASGAVEREWIERELMEGAMERGLSRQEAAATIKSGLEAGLKEPNQDGEPVLSFLDAVPDTLDRPIRLIDGQSYGVTWVPVGVPNEKQGRPEYAQVVFGETGRIYTDKNIPGALPISELPFFVDLPHKPKAEKLLTPDGLRRWMRRDLPAPSDVFKRTVQGIDAFVSFENSLTDQQGMCEFVACWTIGTYFLDAFSVVGYLWPTGERGSGKTQLLNSVTSLAYLGRTITSGSSFAAIRDEADYGATIAFDDCENVRSMESDKRELLLAGNMRGAEISLKEVVGEGEWQTRYVNNFAPRLAFATVACVKPAALRFSDNRSASRRCRSEWMVLGIGQWRTSQVHHGANSIIGLSKN